MDNLTVEDFLNLVWTKKEKSINKFDRYIPIFLEFFLDK